MAEVQSEIEGQLKSLELQLYEKNITMRADIAKQIEGLDERLKMIKPLGLSDVNKAIDTKLTPEFDALKSLIKQLE